MISTIFLSHSAATCWHVARRAVAASIMAVAGLARTIRHRRDMIHLLELSDRELTDIGLSRSEVAGVLAEPWTRDPSVLLMARAVDRRSRARRGAWSERNTGLAG